MTCQATLAIKPCISDHSDDLTNHNLIEQILLIDCVELPAHFLIDYNAFPIHTSLYVFFTQLIESQTLLRPKPERPDRLAPDKERMDSRSQDHGMAEGTVVSRPSQTRSDEIEGERLCVLVDSQG